MNDAQRPEPAASSAALLRYTVVADEPSANVELRLAMRRTPEGVAIDPALGRRGQALRPLAEVRAPTVAAAMDLLADRVRPILVEGQPVRTQPPEVAAQMSALGATSEAALRVYDEGIRALFGAVINDVERTRQLFEEAVVLQPGWAHAELALATNESGPDAFGKAARRVERTRDPSGLRFLEGLELADRQPMRAAAILDEVLQKNPSDVLVGYSLQRIYAGLARIDDSIAVLRRLHAARPDLQFGTDLVTALRVAGRQAEVPRVVEKWISEAPENEQALAAHVALGLERREYRDVERVVRDVLVLYGEAPHRLQLLCDTLIGAERYGEASAIADKLLAAGPLYRPAGRLRVGTLALLEGRFAAAEEALEEARREAEARQDTLVRVRATSALLGLAHALGDAASARRRLAEVSRLVKTGPADDAQAAAVELEAVLLDPARKKCPDLPAYLERVALSPLRPLFERAMIRAAAEHDCASCADVMAAGLGPLLGQEIDLYRYATCAARTGALEEAEEVFRKLARVASEDVGARSPAHAMVARFQLAQVLERQGKLSAARVAYEDFLRHWGRADRPLPAVKEAREALGRLGGDKQ
jgi:tetratricopeptide (TPR) repeat protein